MKRHITIVSFAATALLASSLLVNAAPPAGVGSPPPGGPGGGGGRGAGSGNGDRSTAPARPQHPSTPTEHASANEKGNSGLAPGRSLADAMHEINGTAFDARKQLMSDVDMRLGSSRAALKQIQATAKDQRADARADFKAALENTKAKETELSDSIKAAKKAKAANWEESRSVLAKAFQDHSEALGKLESMLPKPPR